jgi:threonyl-tRNA synthetase
MIKRNQVFDHRTLNEKLKIFLIEDRIGKGLPILLKNGVIIKNIIQNLIRLKEREYGAEEVISPIISDSSLYSTSGHFEHYKDYIFPEIKKDGDVFQLRPMTCPNHCIIYSKKDNSYKSLPLWISEHSILHRYEPSGSLKGLERARWMEISDNHIFTTEEKLKDSFKNCFFFISEILSYFEIKINRFVCSLHKKNDDKYHKNEKLWKISEKILIESLLELKVDFIKEEGEAAFYGPKLDIEVLNLDNKTITISTVQIDFLLPEKFSLKYLDKDGLKKKPVIIHYSSIGTYQRFISIIMEQYKGKFPIWLSPLQFVLLPSNNINEDIIKFCKEIKTDLNSQGFRVELWENDKRLNYNIRKVYNLNIPLYSVIGERELKTKKIILNDIYNKLEKEIEIQDLPFYMKNKPKK